MKILILGGTGSIGSAVTAELVAHHHVVLGLCRSMASAAKLQSIGAQCHMGDLRDPTSWSAALDGVDTVIQLATTFDSDMAEVDTRAMATIRTAARQRAQPLRLIYTGGCWLYGATHDQVASEDSQHHPIASFSWMRDNAKALLKDTNLNCCIVHPAMVYHEDGGGVFARHLDQASHGQPFEVWGSIQTRWPLVHRLDLARAYRMLVERPDLSGHYNVAAQTGVRLQEILDEISKRHHHTGAYVVRNRKHVMLKYGAWAEGPTLDQQMCADKITSNCGWQPDFDDFTQAVF